MSEIYFTKEGQVVPPMRVIRQTTEPTLDANDKMCIWIDTDDSDKPYLVYRRGSGDQVKTILTTSGAPLVADNTSTQKVKVDKGGTLIGTRQEINLIEGSNVTLTVADNSGSDRVDVTVASTSVAPANMARLSTAAVTYYVDSVNGGDANDGLAAGAGRALLTIQAACDKIPEFITHQFIVNIAAGTYTSGFHFQNRQLGGFLGQTSTGFTVQFLGAAHATVDTGTTTSVHGTRPRQLLIDSGKDWSSNAMRGKLVTVGSATYVIRRSGISSGLSDDHTLEIVGVHTADLGPSVAYTIKDWSVNITGAAIRGTTNNSIFIANCRGTRITSEAVRLTNLKVTAPSAGTGGVGIKCDGSDVHIDFCHVDVSGNTTSSTSGIAIYQGNNTRIEDTYVRGSNSNAINCQSGTNVRYILRVCTYKGTAGLNFIGINDISNFDYVYADDHSTACILLQRVNYLYGTYVYVNGVYATNNAVVGIDATYVTGLAIFTGGIIENCKDGLVVSGNTDPATIAIAHGSSSNLRLRGAIIIQNNNRHGVVLVGAGSAKVSTMTGTGNGGYGFYLREGAKLFITPATTLTGTSGDISFDGNALTYTDMGVDGAVANHQDYGTLVKNING